MLGMFLSLSAIRYGFEFAHSFLDRDLTIVESFRQDETVAEATTRTALWSCTNLVLIRPAESAVSGHP